MPESPHLEFWKDIKPINKAFKAGGLPEVYSSKIAATRAHYAGNGIGADYVDTLIR